MEGLGLAQTRLYIFKVWVGTTIVLYVTQHFASHDIRDGPVPVIYFHKTYNLWEEGKVRHNHCSVCHTTFCLSSYAGVRVGTDPVIYFHKTYNL